MYHYTESGLQNVWLRNGYTKHETDYGEGVSIRDVDGLHRAIGLSLARRPRLTGTQLRFLRKEMGMSQHVFAQLIGTSEQTISLWERRGHMTKVADRMTKLIYVEHTCGNVKIREVIERLNDLDGRAERLDFEDSNGRWQEAA